MKNYLALLHKCPLFKDIAPEDLENLLHCLNTSIKSYSSGEIVLATSSQVNHIGIVLDGRVEIVKENFYGNRTLLSLIGPGGLFAEGIVYTTNRISPVSVYASVDTKILIIPYEKMVNRCSNACNFHAQLIHNMLRILSNKNYFLNTKLDFLLLKGIQEKLITYLLYEARQKDSLSFNIAFNRNELAEFLNVSRPSMCRELATLKAEGLLEYYKNSFKILDIEGLTSKLY